MVQIADKIIQQKKIINSIIKAKNNEGGIKIIQQ